MLLDTLIIGAGLRSLTGALAADDRCLTLLNKNLPGVFLAPSAGYAQTIITNDAMRVISEENRNERTFNSRDRKH